MDAKVTWLDRMTFTGVAKSGHTITMDTTSDAGGDDSAVRPIEMLAIALGGCTAMDVISILRKKRQEVTSFDVHVHADRAGEHPKVFTRATLTYELHGCKLDETAVLRAIELSVTKYCPAHAMLSKAFPIEVRYQIFEENGELIHEGVWEPQPV